MFKSLFFLAMLTQMKLMLLVKSSNFPPCTTTTFDTHGFVDLQSMLYDCSTNIGTPLDPPRFFFTFLFHIPYRIYSSALFKHNAHSYFSNVVGASDFEAVNVSLQLSLGSLINVDDLQSTMTMDVFLNLFWVDPRIFMPQLFQHLNPNCLSEGRQDYTPSLSF